MRWLVVVVVAHLLLLLGVLHPGQGQEGTPSPLTTPTPEATATSQDMPLLSESLQFIMSSQTVDLLPLPPSSISARPQVDTTATASSSTAAESSVVASVVFPVSSAVPPVVFSSDGGFGLPQSTEVLLLPSPSAPSSSSAVTLPSPSSSPAALTPSPSSPRTSAATTFQPSPEFLPPATTTRVSTEQFEAVSANTLTAAPSVLALSSQVPLLQESSQFLLPIASTAADLLLPLTTSPRLLIPISIPSQTALSTFQASPSSVFQPSSPTPVEQVVSTRQTSLSSRQTPFLQPTPQAAQTSQFFETTAAVFTEPLLVASSQLAPPPFRTSLQAPPLLSSRVQNTNLLMPFSSEPPGRIVTGAISSAPLTFTLLPLFPSTPSPSQPGTPSPLTAPTPEATVTSQDMPLLSESLQFIMSSQTVDLLPLPTSSISAQPQVDTTVSVEASTVGASLDSVIVTPATAASSVAASVVSPTVNFSRTVSFPVALSSLGVFEPLQSTEVLLLPTASSAVQPTASSPSAVQPTAGSPSAVQPTSSSPSAVQPTASSPSASTPAEPAVLTSVSQPSTTFSFPGASLRPSAPSPVQSPKLSPTPAESFLPLEETSFLLPFSSVPAFPPSLSLSPTAATRQTSSAGSSQVSPSRTLGTASELPSRPTPPITAISPTSLALEPSSSPLAPQTNLLSSFQTASVTAIQASRPSVLQTSSVTEFPSVSFEEPSSTSLFPATILLPLPSLEAQTISVTLQPSPSPSLQITADTLQPSPTTPPFSPTRTTVPLLPTISSEEVTLSSVEQSLLVPSSRSVASESPAATSRGPAVVLPSVSSRIPSSSELFIATTSELLLLPTALDLTSTVARLPTSVPPSAIASESLPLSSTDTTSGLDEATAVPTSRGRTSVAGTGTIFLPISSSTTSGVAPTPSTSLVQPGTTAIVSSILPLTSRAVAITATDVPIPSVQPSRSLLTASSELFPTASVSSLTTLVLVPTVSEQTAVIQSETTTQLAIPTSFLATLVTTSADTAPTIQLSTQLAQSPSTQPAGLPTSQLTSTEQPLTTAQPQTTQASTQLASSQPTVTQPTVVQPSVVQPTPSATIPMAPPVTTSISTPLPPSPLPPTMPSQPNTSTVVPQAEITTQVSAEATSPPPPSPPTVPPSPPTTSPSPPTSSAPPPTPSPTPFCTPPPFPPTSNSRVIIVLGLIREEFNDLLIEGHPRRCRLQQALVEVFVLGRAILKVTGPEYQAEILDVGALASGQSSITFFLADLSSAQPVEGAVVIESFAAANVQEVDTYPIISPVSLSGPTDSQGASPVAIVAGVAGGVILVLVVVLLALLGVGICYRKKTTTRVDPLRQGEAGTFRPTEDFQYDSHSASVELGTPASLHHGTPASIRQGPSQTPRVSIAQLANSRGPSAEDDHIPGRSDSQLEPEPLPVSLFERVAHYDTPQPSPPTRALRMRFRTAVAPSPPPSPPTSHRSQKSRSEEESEESRRLREDALRQQEKREEQEIKSRKKATLERLRLQSRQSHTGRRRRRKPGGSFAASGRREGDGIEGDIEASSPAAPPLEAPQATSPRPDTRRRRKKLNRIGPAPASRTADGYDSIDRHYSRIPASRQSHNFKLGRSNRARPLATTGRLSRRVAHNVHQELALMDPGAVVQLVRLQPVPQVQYSHPPHPLAITAQPRPAWDKLPTVSPLQSQSYTQRQWETYQQVHKDMDELSLDRSGTLQPTPAPGPTHHTLDHTHQLHPQHSSPIPLAPQLTPQDTVERTRPQAAAEQPKRGVAQEEEKRVGPRPPGEHSPAQTPPESASAPNQDSSSTQLQEVLQQAFTSSQPQGAGLGRVTSAPPVRDDGMVQATLPRQPTYHSPAPAGAWHTVPPQLMYAATPAHYHTPTPVTYHQLPGQLVWAPEPALVPPTTQMLTPAHLTQLRSTPFIGRHDYGGPGGYDQFADPFHTPKRHTMSHSHARSRTRRDQLFIAQ